MVTLFHPDQTSQTTVTAGLLAVDNDPDCGTNCGTVTCAAFGSGTGEFGTVGFGAGGITATHPIVRS